MGSGLVLGVIGSCKISGSGLPLSEFLILGFETYMLVIIMITVIIVVIRIVIIIAVIITTIILSLLLLWSQVGCSVLSSNARLNDTEPSVLFPSFQL